MRLNKAIVQHAVRVALLEDRARRDVTTLEFIAPRERVRAWIIAKEKGVVCGLDLARETFKSFDRTLNFKALKKDGDKIHPNEFLVEIRGKARSVLSCERVALNFLSHLSGIATLTQQVVVRARRHGITILDTRKTLPLLRFFEKYAVAKGGGRNHRFDLSGQYLVKDNHLFILNKHKSHHKLTQRRKDILFEIEVENMEELERALLYMPDILMLDNFRPSQIKRAIHFLKNQRPSGIKKPKIELSGGITLTTLDLFLIRGVDFISLGFLTHSARTLDISLDIVACL